MKAVLIRLSHWPRVAKLLIFLGIDLLVWPVLMWLAFALRLLKLDVWVMAGLVAWPVWLGVLASGAMFVCGIYHTVVRYYNEQWLMRLLLAVLLVMIGLYIIAWLQLAFVPISIPFMFGFLMLLWVWGSRLIIRFLVQYAFQRHDFLKRIGIYGAGEAAHQMLSALQLSHDYLVVALFDDKVSLTGKMINGIRVYPGHRLPKYVKKLSIQEIIIAMPSASKAKRRKVIKRLESAHVSVKEVPTLEQLVTGRVKISDVHEVDIMDLLGRDPVPANAELMHKNITDKVVMVTGAGGSIGSELCRQIIKNQPKLLILFELSEYALYAIEHELRQLTSIQVLPILGSVLNEEKLKRVMQQYHVQTVYHAAAYKHVPIVEKNPLEGLKNNAVGTACCARAAAASGVEAFVLISTDKAVRPTNVMGASKRLAELICQSMAAEPALKTQFSMVRFGNVLGSSGSVVPLFRKQIAQGGPITITHPEVTRYFMTIPEAAELVIQAGAMGQGGDVFLLDMGQSVKIKDLARQMVFLSGLRVREGDEDGDIEIVYTGLRPGEKLYEELLIDQENVQKTAHPRIMRSYEKFIALEDIEALLARITLMSEENKTDMDWVLTKLEQYVDGYKRSQQVVCS